MSNAAQPTVVETAARRVTFFEDRAEVTRTGKATISDGRGWVRLGGMTTLLDDRTVQARVLSDRVKVLGVKVERYHRNVNELSRDELHSMQKVIRDMNASLSALEKKHQRLDAQASNVGELLDKWAELVSRVPLPGEDSGPEEWRKAWQTLIERDDKLVLEILEVLDEKDDLTERIRNENSKLSDLNTTRTLFRCDVLVQVEAAAMDEVELETTYRTPCAVWRPEHLARLNSDDGEVEWTIWGVVWQRTGEDWNNVETRFSTARPAQVADAPEIDDDTLSKRKKTDEEKKQVQVQMREETIANAGGAREEPQMPGVDDGGKPVEFVPAGAYELPSNGKPVRVEIDRRTLKAEVSRVLIAERSQTTWLKVDTTWDGAAPLLAGPLSIARGPAMVGRSRSGFVSTGEKFETGFGPEDGIRCKRSVVENREKAKLTGSQTIKRKVHLHISSLGGTSFEVGVLERIPVSEIKGLEVELKDAKDWTLDDDGYLHHTFTPTPGANVTLTYEYEIHAKSNIVLPF